MSDLASLRQRLATHGDEIGPVPMRDLFASDPDRFQRFSLRLDDLLFDYSKNRITAETIDLLVRLAEAAGVERRRDEMFAGEPVNTTENRAALHMALRSCAYRGYRAGDVDVMPHVHDQLGRIARFSDGVRSGRFNGTDGSRFTDVVNIGVGGSDLGPAMATAALRPYHDGPKLHFVSNMDGAHIADTLAALDPRSTLFLVASKSFTTAETMANAGTAREWLVGRLGPDAVADHFAALSVNREAVAAFGIRDDFTFGFWDWVGGRYSVWSAIGLPLCLAVGFANFQAFLRGGEAVDRHFRSAPIRQNIPFIMALLGIWYRNVWGFSSHAVIPYDQRLARLPAYLQQLDMESNGKSVRLDGSPVEGKTGPVVWGEPGTNSQHAVFQLLHQGTDVVPVDFLIAARGHDGLPGHHSRLAANCFAQSEALMMGRTAEEAAAEMRAAGVDEDGVAALLAHKVMPGNRPSNTLLYGSLDPYALGRLIALYEHRVFVQGAIWGVNSFDQWGVESGKQRASELLPMVEGLAPATGRDSSTAGLIGEFVARNADDRAEPDIAAPQAAIAVISAPRRRGRAVQATASDGPRETANVAGRPFA